MQNEMHVCEMPFIFWRENYYERKGSAKSLHNVGKYCVFCDRKDMSTIQRKCWLGDFLWLK